jgi:hypothetical protein
MAGCTTPTAAALLFANDLVLALERESDRLLALVRALRERSFERVAARP